MRAVLIGAAVGAAAAFAPTAMPGVAMRSHTATAGAQLRAAPVVRRSRVSLLPWRPCGGGHRT